MAKEYSSAPDVRDIAERIIEILKPELEGFEIRYVFGNENPKKDGREVTALARKVIGLNAYLAGHPEGFFVVEVGFPAWSSLTPDQRIAVVHHELCHFGITDDGGLAIIPHDIEEFHEIARIHGSYHDGLVTFGHALQHGNETSREEIRQKILNE
jgi:predicted metallopeptidase